MSGKLGITPSQFGICNDKGENNRTRERWALEERNALLSRVIHLKGEPTKVFHA